MGDDLIERLQARITELEDSNRRLRNELNRIEGNARAVLDEIDHHLSRISMAVDTRRDDVTAVDDEFLRGTA